MEKELSNMAELFRDNVGKIMKGIMKVSLSPKFINYFYELHGVDVFGETSMTSSFQMSLNSNKAELARDIQIISDIFQKTAVLKLIPEETSVDLAVDISKFKSLSFLELHRVKVSSVAGIQELREQINKLICSYSIKTLKEILENCGSDNSTGNIWSKLKDASFPHNGLNDLGNSLDYSPWLQRLDLSYNYLSSVKEVNSLCNLKHLNLAFNKLERAPQFSGSLCNRLQTLVLKNNFIEDIEGLISLGNLYELDLSDNCLVDHKSLAAISHIASLRSLNLEGNPLSFHPQHRNRTCCYLHKNTGTIAFVLDYVVLKKSEKSLLGSLHPIQRSQALLVNSLSSDSINLTSERPRRIRNVTIQENDMQIITPTRSPNTFTAHLATKKQIEYLREQHGDSWLKEQSGLMVQDVLGLERSCTFLSSTPRSDFDVCTSNELSPTDNQTFATIDTTVATTTDKATTDKEPYSEDEDVDEGEEYLCYLDNEDSKILLVVTETHISERDSMTRKLHSRWHLNTVVKCELANEDGTRVELNFDTVRRNWQKRCYTLSEDDAKKLVEKLKEKMDLHKVEQKLTVYQCMKCGSSFSRKNVSVYTESLSCRSCESNLIIEYTGD